MSLPICCNALSLMGTPVESVGRQSRLDPAGRSKIIGVGTATSESSYSQEDILDIFKVEDRRIRSLFLNGSIKRRYLALPQPDASGNRRVETQAELLDKHKTLGMELGISALQKSLQRAGATVDDVRYLCCVSTTGLLTPGFSALLCDALHMRHDCGRLDVVGMGCNAGLNALNVVANWAQARPGELAILLCIEACSAAYVFDGSMRTAVVNSLFGDGAAAMAVRADAEQAAAGPVIVKFASCLIPKTLDAMRFDWDQCHGKFSFFLDRDIPYIIGANSEEVVDRLLAGTSLRRNDIAHWIVHAGGKKVIDAVRINLGLTGNDLRHTSGVLQDYGNLSSSSFLFSYERLLAEKDRIRAGDYGVFMTMGPGSTIETALIHWPSAPQPPLHS
jgi:alkylresorcinol/alkylpyrone synthase/polyketide synthase Type III